RPRPGALRDHKTRAEQGIFTAAGAVRHRRRCGMNAPAPTISAELRALLRRVKLGRSLDTLPERLALAKTHSMGHAEFLELVISDEVTRRETTSAALRAKGAGLEPDMYLENW